MKKILLLLLLIWVVTQPVFSQSAAFCGSVATPTPEKDHEALVELLQAGSPEGNLPPKVIPVKVHIIREDDGSGGMSPGKVIPGIDTLNAFFSQTNMQFSLCSGPTFIDNSDFYVLPYDLATQSYDPVASEMVLYNEPDMVNIFVVDSFIHPTAWLLGIGTSPWADLRLVLIHQDFFDSDVLAHEMGHFMGLYHTHEDAHGDGQEYVNGSNCQSAGDFLCDTPADPNLLEYTDEFCQYTGTLTDPLGDAYQPQVENIMSYSGCLLTFSPNQILRMNYFLLNYMWDFSCNGSTLGDSAYLILYTAIQPQPSIMSCGVSQTIEAGIINNGPVGITANFGAALLDTEGNFYAWIDTLSGPVTLNSNYYFPWINFIESNPNYPAGDYQIGIFYRKSGAATWLPIEEGGHDNTLPIQMTCGVPCQAPSAPELSGVGYSHFKVSWQELPSVTEYQTRQRKVGVPSWTNGGWYTDASVYWASLTPCTDYEVQVQARCGAQTTGFSPSLVVSTQGCGDSYCYSYGLTWDDWIQKVEFGGFNHTSGNDYGYGNFTALKAAVNQGSSNPIKLTAGTNDDPATVFWRVWIDFNQDNDFADAGEMVLQMSASNSAPLTGNIAIPTGLSPGITRMRVSMSPDSYSIPCSQFGNREIEDYSIEILPIPAISPNPTQLDFSAEGGMAEVDVDANISWTASSPDSWLTIENGAGTGSATFSVNCSENTEITPRSTAIALEGNGADAIITVVQEGAMPYLEASALQLNFDPTGLPAQEVFVNANIPWEATCAEGWVNISNSNGTGAGAFSVTCTENADLAPRTATILLSGNGLELSITIDQEGVIPFLEASLQQLDFDQTGQPAQVVAVSSNVAWEANTIASWINIAGNTGAGDGAFQVSCEENPDPDPRTTSIILSGNGLELTILVMQEGKPSSVSAPSGDAWISCYPNPTSGQVTWSGVFSSCAEATLTVFTEEGKTLFERTIWVEPGNAWQIAASLQPFPSGLYFYRVDACGQSTVGEVYRK
jgi:hypothetical protein